MTNIKQKSIEQFFDEFKVKKAELKAKLLPALTDVIYDYNLSVVKYEKEKDAYRQKQILVEIGEIEQKIKEVFETASVK